MAWRMKAPNLSVCAGVSLLAGSAVQRRSGRGHERGRHGGVDQRMAEPVGEIAADRRGRDAVVNFFLARNERAQDMLRVAGQHADAAQGEREFAAGRDDEVEHALRKVGAELAPGVDVDLHDAGADDAGDARVGQRDARAAVHQRAEEGAVGFAGRSRGVHTLFFGTAGVVGFVFQVNFPKGRVRGASGHVDEEAFDVEDDGIRRHGDLAGRVLRLSGDDVEFAEVERALHGAPVQIPVGETRAPMRADVVGRVEVAVVVIERNHSSIELDVHHRARRQIRRIGDGVDHAGTTACGLRASSFFASSSSTVPAK